VQRYILANLNGGVGYRHYSAPVSNSSVNDLATTGFTPIVNSDYNTLGNTVTPFPNVFGYNEARVTTSGGTAPIDFDKGFFSPNALSDALEVTRGYTVNINASALVDFTGTLNNGVTPLTASGLTRGGQTESGYHLRGNPFPSPLDWNAMVANGRLTNVQNALYVFKSSGQYTGSYASYVNGVGVGGGTNVLPVAQGFFVRTVAGQTGSLSFTNAERLTTDPGTPFQRGTADSRPQLALTLRNATTANQTAVYFEQGATASFDAAFDAAALPAPNGLVLATEVGAEGLSINGLPLLTGADVVVTLRLAATTAGTYTLAVDNLANLPGAGYRSGGPGPARERVPQPGPRHGHVAAARGLARHRRHGRRGSRQPGPHRAHPHAGRWHRRNPGTAPGRPGSRRVLGAGPHQRRPRCQATHRSIRSGKRPLSLPTEMPRPLWLGHFCF